MENKSKSRREFIRDLTLTGSVAFLASTPWLSVLGEDASNKKSAGNKVRLAIIGTGSRGMELIRNLVPVLAENNAEICALCDNFPLHLKQAVDFCRENNLTPKAYDDYRRLIEAEKPDGVIIATPLTEHTHITVDCLTAGIHTFCEKAMARTIEDVKKMYDTHVSTGKILQIGHQRLFNPIYLEGIKRIHDGELGVIGQIRAYWHRNLDWRRPLPGNDPRLEKQINWRLYKELSAGPLTEFMSHQIPVAFLVLGQYPVSVIGTGSTVFWKDSRTVPDNVALIFSFPNGVQCIYDSMISNAKYGWEEQIMGHKGTIEFEVNRLYNETVPTVPGIKQLVNNIEHGIFDKINVAGSSWVPETAVTYKGERIAAKDLYNDTQFELEGFIMFIREGKISKEMTDVSYYASIWSLLAETAIETGQKVLIPEGYSI